MKAFKQVRDDKGGGHNLVLRAHFTDACSGTADDDDDNGEP